MFDSWKYSNCSYFVIIFTSAIATLILGIAYHFQNFSEILMGVIGALTIILGMLTAEWLSSSRQQMEETPTSSMNLILNLERLLSSFDEFAANQFSPQNCIYWPLHERCSGALKWQARSTRWLQPNAKKIRNVAQELFL